jgi:hypothetical protein
LYTLCINTLYKCGWGGKEAGWPFELDGEEEGRKEIPDNERK